MVTLETVTEACRLISEGIAKSDPFKDCSVEVEDGLAYFVRPDGSVAGFMNATQWQEIATEND